MMHADLIDQEDLLGLAQVIGFQAASGATAEQACECAVRGLTTNGPSCCAPWSRICTPSSATILPAVRQAIDKQLPASLGAYQQSHHH